MFLWGEVFYPGKKKKKKNGDSNNTNGYFLKR
jgi:hypothetical protein